MYDKCMTVLRSLIYAACLVWCVKSATLDYGDVCVTPKGKSGTCIKASECERVVQIQSNSTSTNAERSYLQSADCGFSTEQYEPLVCCPKPLLAHGDKCTTSKGAPGSCIRGTECPYLLAIRRKNNISQQEEMYLQNLRCGYMRNDIGKRMPLFCCPKHQNSPDCGLSKNAVDSRIMGGDEVEPGTHPWFALLIYKDGRNKSHPSCGGSLITERHVLTAAHCLLPKPGWTLHRVRFNEWNPTSSKSCAHLRNGETVCRQDYAVASWVTHPEYINNGSFSHDIAVIRLAMDVAFSEYVRTICLPTTPEIRALPLIGRMFRVSGFGMNDIGDALSSHLREVELPSVPNEECDIAYAWSNVTLTENQLCVGGLEGLDSCRGDSGGALLRDVGITVYQVGVVSFGPHICGTAYIPSVYTNVGSYIPWIESIIFDGLLL